MAFAEPTREDLTVMAGWFSPRASEVGGGSRGAYCLDLA